MKLAVCPGSFDPITVGHLDLVERAAAIFDRVVVCVMVNGEKHPMFTLEERLEMIRGAVAHMPGVEAAVCGGLLADFARERHIQALSKTAGTRKEIDASPGSKQIPNKRCFVNIIKSLCPYVAEKFHAYWQFLFCFHG